MLEAVLGIVIAILICLIIIGVEYLVKRNKKKTLYDFKEEVKEDIKNGKEELDDIVKSNKIESSEEDNETSDDSDIVEEFETEIVKENVDIKDKVEIKEEKALNLSELTVPELKDLCKSKGLTGYSKKTKPELIKLLSE